MATTGTTAARKPKSAKRSSSARSNGGNRNRPKTGRKPQQRSGPGPVANALKAIGRGLGKLLALLARAMGTGARGIGQGAKNIDPSVRRDGWGMVLVALAIVVAARFWFGLGGWLGNAVGEATSTLFGLFSYAIPVLLLFWAWKLFRSQAKFEADWRRAIGSVMILFGVLGIIHLANGLPGWDDQNAVKSAGGAVGFLASTAMEQLVNRYLAWPLLVLVVLFGVIVFVDRSIREIAGYATGAVAGLRNRKSTKEDLDIGADVPYDTPLITDAERVSEDNDSAEATMIPPPNFSAGGTGQDLERSNKPEADQAAESKFQQRQLFSDENYLLPDSSILHPGTAPKARTEGSDEIVRRLA
ncbi:MAG: hypothetical protein CR979_01545, partial [Propionibacterium sp.]